MASAFYTIPRRKVTQSSILSCDRDAAFKAINKLMSRSNGSLRSEILSLARKLDIDL